MKKQQKIIHLTIEELQRDFIALADQVVSANVAIIIRDKRGNLLKLELAARPRRAVNGRFVYACEDTERMGVAPP